MTTISTLKKEFKTDKNGTIQNPGKFEGESLATPFYYDLYLNGEGCVIKIKPSDRHMFNIDDKYTFVYIAESNDGFISLEWCEDKKSAEYLDYNNSDECYFDSSELED